MELKQLEAFVSVADNLSFSKAAEMLYLTQPTVSSHISALEKELGCRLFDRTTKSLKVTEQGRKIYPYANRIIELRDAIASQLDEGAEVSISIGASTIPATYLLPEIMSKMTEKGSRFKIRQGNSLEVEELVNDGAVEVGFIGQEPTYTALCGEKICTDNIVLVTPANEYYTELRKKGVGIGELLLQPLILREDGSGTQRAADDFFERFGGVEKLNVVARNNNQETIKRMVAAGIGVSVMSYYAAEDLEKQGSVYCYPIWPKEQRAFYAIYIRDRVQKPLVKELIRLAHEMYE